MRNTPPLSDVTEPVSAYEYLAHGFFDAALKVHPHINGQYSMAMARRCHSEGLSPEKMSVVVDSLLLMLEDQMDDAPKTADKRATDSLDKIKRLAMGKDIQNSPVLSELFASGINVIKQQRDLQAFVQHLQRIVAQLALLQSLGKAPI